MVKLRTDKNKKLPTLEEYILLLQNEGKHKSLSIAEIIRFLSKKGRPLIITLLILPFCQPIQIPGLSILFGILIALIGLRMVFRKRIWLPKTFLKKNIPTNVLNRMTENGLGFLRKIKPWIHPRLSWLCRSPFIESVNGLMIFFLGILLAFPLPIPLSNLAVAWSIFFIAFGVLEDDGLVILMGYFISVLTFLFFVLIGISIKNHLFT